MGTSKGINRREFLLKAGALGLSATSLAALLAACRKIPEAPPPLPSIVPAPSSAAKSNPTIATPAPTPAWGASLSTEELKVRHLLRRAGFGASPAELKQYTAMGLSAATDYLLNYQNVDDSALEARLTALNIDTTRLPDIQRWWLVRMIYGKRPLQEKMTLFWHGLLTSGISKVGQAQLMFDQNQLLRSQALEDYAVLLKAIARDPAMMLWLDSRLNRKGAPNENFARELMELFTLGIGHYTEIDVRESARAFTGWTQLAQGFYLDLSQHDNGIKTFLGQSGNLNGDDVIDIIMQQPAAAEYISRRLFEFFAYDNPDPATISKLAAVFTASGRNIKALVRSIFTSEEFYSEQAFRSKIKSPAELVAGSIRALGIESGGAELVGPVNNLGQILFNPPDVSGWKGGAAWINSNTLLYRINFANQVTASRGTALKFTPADLLNLRPDSTAEGTVGAALTLLLDGITGPKEKDVLTAFMANKISTATPTSNDETLRELIYLIMASPDYQLA